MTPSPQSSATYAARNAFVVEAPGEPATLCISRRAVEELPPDQLDAMLARVTGPGGRRR